MEEKCVCCKNEQCLYFSGNDSNRDSFKECCILSKEDVSDIIKHLSVLRLGFLLYTVYDDVRNNNFIIINIKCLL